MKSIESEVNLSGKKVLLRLDLNVPLKDKKIIDKILNDLYEYLYNLIKNDIKKNIDINNNDKRDL